MTLFLLPIKITKFYKWIISHYKDLSWLQSSASEENLGVLFPQKNATSHSKPEKKEKKNRNTVVSENKENLILVLCHHVNCYEISHLTATTQKIKH